MKTFIEEMSSEDHQLLDFFLHKMVRSINGYVIYGDKPIGLVPYLNTISYLPGGTDRMISLVRGTDLWKRLNISPENKEYLLLQFNCNGYCNFAAINRKAFIKVVNENISLFRYVLGPTLTAEKLLEQLIHAKDNFYQVLKDDNALLGILLGYGTQNALLGSRIETICYSFAADQQEQFPFLPCQVRMNKPSHPKNVKHSASFGFSTLMEEADMLESLTVSSHQDPPLKPYALPYFGCIIDSEETKNLMSTYHKNKTDILNAVEDPEFLEKTLTKFLTTTSQTVELPQVSEKAPLPELPNSQEASRKLADLITMNVGCQEKLCLDFCLQSYIKGMEAQEKDGQSQEIERMPPHWSEGCSLRDELTQMGNLRKANTYLKRVAKSEGYVCQIPDGIYYKTLRKGKGEPASSKISDVSFHYSCRTVPETKHPFIGTIEEESPEHFIAGIHHALIGMKRGEERLVVIHPKYGYGDQSFLPPNSVLVAKIQLLDFEEGDQEIAIAPPYDLQLKETADLQARYEEIKSKQYFDEGRFLWQQIKPGNLFDLQAVKKAIAEGMKKPFAFSSFEEACDFSIQVKEVLRAQKPVDCLAATVN